VYISKSQLVNLLKDIGVEVIGNKVNKNNFRSIFGARYVEPEWMLLSDYKLEAPDSYLDYIELEEAKLNRIIFPETYSIASFNKFADYTGTSCGLIGLVYQYALKGNPRNVHYAYRLFLGSKHVSKNSGFGSLHEAKNECTNEARSLIETKLFDVN